MVLCLIFIKAKIKFIFLYFFKLFPCDGVYHLSCKVSFKEKTLECDIKPDTRLQLASFWTLNVEQHQSISGIEKCFCFPEME